MGQMFDKTRDQMNNWRWDKCRAFEDQVDRSNPQTTSLGIVKHTGECFSWYVSNNLTAKIEPPSFRQYKQGDFLAISPLNCDEIIHKDDKDDNWADPGAPSSGRSHPGNGNDNDDSESEEDMQGSEKATGKGKGTKDGNGRGKATGDGNRKGKGKGKGHSKGKGIVKHTPGGDDPSSATALQLHKDLSEADLDMEGKLERIYLEPEASLALSISSDVDTYSTESSGEYVSERDSDVDMRIEDDVDTPDGIDLDGDVDMETDCEAEEDEEEEDEKEE